MTVETFAHLALLVLYGVGAYMAGFGTAEWRHRKYWRDRWLDATQEARRTEIALQTEIDQLRRRLNASSYRPPRGQV